MVKANKLKVIRSDCYVVSGFPRSMNPSGAGKEMYNKIGPDLDSGNQESRERCAPAKREKGVGVIFLRPTSVCRNQRSRSKTSS